MTHTLPLRVAFISQEDPADITGWSGLNFFMVRALREAGCEVVPLHTWRKSWPPSAVFWKLAHKAFRLGHYSESRNRSVLRSYARQMEGRLQRIEVDAVFSPGTALTALLKPKVPWFYWTDATVPSLFRSYPGYEKWSARSLRDAYGTDAEGAREASGIFLSSSWAAESAIRDVGVEPSKVHVVPFGANLEVIPPRDAVLRRSAGRRRDRVVLLFAGVQWVRKGGGKAVAIADALSRLVEVPVELRILGIDASAGATGTRVGGAEVVHLGRISKATPEGSARIGEEFLNAHFLVLPTLADCTPIVFAEACVHALPIVTHDVGGVGSQVAHGQNGGLFGRETDPSVMAQWIRDVWSAQDSYNSMCGTSREVHESKLNWSVAGATVTNVMRSVIREARRRAG